MSKNSSGLSGRNNSPLPDSRLFSKPGSFYHKLKTFCSRENFRSLFFPFFPLSFPTKPRSSSRVSPTFSFPENQAKFLGLTGLEPVTLRLSSACSNQLSYRPCAGMNFSLFPRSAAPTFF